MNLLHSTTPLLLLLTLLLPCLSDSDKPCRDQCGTLPVHYPFGIDDGCGAPQFRHMFTCNISSNSLFFITPNGNYKVQDIDYKAQTMTVYDPDMSTCTILQPHHDVVLTDIQYAIIPPSPDTVFALLNCSVDSPILHRFRSLCFDIPGHQCQDLYSSCNSFKVFTTNNPNPNPNPNPGPDLGAGPPTPYLGAGPPGPSVSYSGGRGSTPGASDNLLDYNNNEPSGGGYYGSTPGASNNIPGNNYGSPPSGGYYGSPPSGGYYGSTPGASNNIPGNNYGSPPGGGYYGSTPGGSNNLPGNNDSPPGGYYGSTPGASNNLPGNNDHPPGYYYGGGVGANNNSGTPGGSNNFPGNSNSGPSGMPPPPCCFTGYSTVKVMRMDILDCTHFTSFYNTDELKGVSPMDWKYGLKFSYSVPDMGCERCRKSGGSCGFDAETEALLCLCSASNNSTRQCGSDTGDSELRTPSIMLEAFIIGLGLFFLLPNK